MKSEQVLDALVGAKATPANEREASAAGPRGFIQEALSAFGLGDDRSGNEPRSGLGQGFSDARDTLGQWGAKAKEAMGRNPTLTAGALAATAGLLLSGAGGAFWGTWLAWAASASSVHWLTTLFATTRIAKRASRKSTKRL